MKKILLRILISTALIAMLLLFVACGGKNTTAHEHTWLAASCTEPRRCEGCGKTYGEPLGHTEVVDEAVAPTCSEPGKTEGKHCSVCNTVIVEQKSTGIFGHKWEAHISVTPKTCSLCGMTEKEHEYTATETAPSCMTYGFTSYVCACGDTYKDSFTDPLGHDWENDANGESKTCVRSGCTMTEKISAVPDDKNLVLGLESIPIANSNMTEDELRDLIIEFMRLQLSFGYQADMRALPTGRYQYYIKNLYTVKHYANKDPNLVDNVKLTLSHGKYYGGIPYTGNAAGSPYRWVPFYNADTCVMDYSPIYYSSVNFSKRVNVDYGIDGYPIFPNIGSSVFGNSCASSVFWAWSRVSNEINDCWSHSWRDSNGQLILGDVKVFYQGNGKIDYDKTFNRGVSDNTAEDFYAAYALLKKADGVATTGHGSIVHDDPVIVYDENGNIDPDKSYILVSSNSAGWWQTVNDVSTGVYYSSPLNDRGDRYMVMCYLPYFIKNQYGADEDTTEETKRSFRVLYRDKYLPFTIPELAGRSEIEKATVEFDYAPRTIRISRLETLSISSNYYISDVQFVVVDNQGHVAFNGVYADEFDGIKYLKTASLDKALNQNVLYETPTHIKTGLSALADGEHYVLIKCRVSTGELITVYSGLLAE